MDNFLILAPFVAKTVSDERPARILEISCGGTAYGRLLKAMQSYCGIQDGVVDRITAPDSPELYDDAVYDSVTGWETPDGSHEINNYDFILISGLFERIEPERARAFLDMLQYKITKQIMVITPLYSGEGFRKYHPIVFLGLDFCFSPLYTAGETMQVYSVFPKIRYKPISLDGIPTSPAVRELRIAIVLPHQNLTGGIKALLQQVRQLTRRGHAVSVYFRSDKAASAIPEWSDLTDEDYSGQIVIPASSRYLDCIKDTDVILLGWVFQIPEFIPSAIPVALWEQGSEMMYGEFGKSLNSMSEERLILHRLFRMPVHLLAVSDTNISALKGIYNRNAFLFPNGVDTEFYHPAEKHNDIPVILLAGNPSLPFKGFNFAFDVLSKAYAAGLLFQVKWASQIPVTHGGVDFPLEVTVNPSQPELAEMFRSSDIFLSTSLYESYPLPPLEAMASGTAVIASDCGGIRTYATPDKNCILCRQGDRDSMINALSKLLSDRDERERLAAAGRKTALEHSAQVVVKLLESRLSSIANRE